jgi:hypothetical protein
VTAAVVIFALTYVAIAGGRFPLLSVDRPAAAFLGAALMVAAGVLAPGEAGRAVNGDTIGLLLGMMVLTEYLREAAFFRWTSWRVLRAVHGPRTLLWGVVLTAGALSAFLVNDTVCLMMTPIVLRIVDDAELPALPYLLAVAFGSNAGSVATLTGNPQNMIVGTLSGIPYAEPSPLAAAARGASQLHDRGAGCAARPGLAAAVARSALTDERAVDEPRGAAQDGRGEDHVDESHLNLPGRAAGRPGGRRAPCPRPARSGRRRRRRTTSSRRTPAASRWRRRRTACRAARRS